MIPRIKDLLLKKKVKLYNNIAQNNDCTGRLLAELEVYHTPRIIWEFEMIGEANCNFPCPNIWNGIVDGNETPPIFGHCFQINNPVLNGFSNGGICSQRSIRGLTKQAVYGNLQNKFHQFTFYLPNARFQKESNGQQTLQKTVRNIETEQIREIDNNEGRLIDIPIDNAWSLRLQTQAEALNWLERQKKNIGTLITTVGEIYQPNLDLENPESFAEFPSISLEDAVTRITDLSRLLSYANGGYIAPLYVEGSLFGDDPQSLDRVLASTVLVFPITPLEQLSISWLTSQSNLSAYVQRLSSLESMIQSQVWKETFDFVMIQYFQATHPNTAWQVCASSVGAALERLSYAILVEDTTNTDQKTNYELLFDQ
jgi:hypothetical protein